MHLTNEDSALSFSFLQQYLKVFIAYTQVIGGFVAFKVSWPINLGLCISWVQNTSSLLKFDFLELPFPGLPCVWESISYEFKLYVRLATPIVVSCILVIPTFFAYMRMRQSKAKQNEDRSAQRVAAGVDGDEENPPSDALEDINWVKRYDKTLDVFWNNIMWVLPCLNSSAYLASALICFSLE